MGYNDAEGYGKKEDSYSNSYAEGYGKKEDSYSDSYGSSYGDGYSNK
ncbi:MAG: hypothetical protein PUB25_01875 [Lachnospiraceae bacterium]|nr:hypothetical protein [Lachnospiraceae bacterium]